ncbi:hypothetical protein T484DRAFT_2272568 [Baffinella frigidus]|nr:hypothetical protein T484DRAFT_2272568 [Cryptophyta sp. CCMP2293]
MVWRQAPRTKGCAEPSDQGCAESTGDVQLPGHQRENQREKERDDVAKGAHPASAVQCCASQKKIDSSWAERRGKVPLLLLHRHDIRGRCAPERVGVGNVDAPGKRDWSGWHRSELRTQEGPQIPPGEARAPPDATATPTGGRCGAASRRVGAEVGAFGRASLRKKLATTGLQEDPHPIYRPRPHAPSRRVLSVRVDGGGGLPPGRCGGVEAP